MKLLTVICLLGVNQVQVLSAINEKSTITTRYHHENTFTVTLLVEISNDPLLLTLKSSTNDQFDFISFIAEVCEKRKLLISDYLICDNARIHKAKATADIFQ